MLHSKGEIVVFPVSSELKKEIEKLGGNVVGISVVINIKELNNDELFSILDVNEE